MEFSIPTSKLLSGKLNKKYRGDNRSILGTSVEYHFFLQYDESKRKLNFGLCFSSSPAHETRHAPVSATFTINGDLYKGEATGKTDVKGDCDLIFDDLELTFTIQPSELTFCVKPVIGLKRSPYFDIGGFDQNYLGEKLLKTDDHKDFKIVVNNDEIKV